MEEAEGTHDDIIEEEYNSDEEYEQRRPLSLRSTLQKLKQNDPSVTQLEINLNLPDDDETQFFDSIDWEEDGHCISDNEHLKKVNISFPQRYHSGEHKEQLQDFFSCIYQNNSINHIILFSNSILHEFGGSLIEGFCGHSSLTVLDVSGHARDGDVGIGCIAIKKVLNHPESKVKDLRLSCLKFDDDSRIDILFDSLVGNSKLERLSLNSYIGQTYTDDTGFQDVDPGCWLRALSNLSNVIRDPRCKLSKLSLNSIRLNDEVSDILGNALCGSSVKDLDLSENREITSAGWQRLLNKLSQVALVSLDLSGNDIDDNSGISALANIGTLKSLKLSSNHSMTPNGWQAFYNSLQNRGTQLVKLDISNTCLGNEGAAAVGTMVSNMSTLKTLFMSDIGIFEGDGTMSSHFNTLQGSNLNLINLCLCDPRIDDDGIQALTRLISRMSSLKKLSLGYNNSVTPTGWQVLTDYLQSPNFALIQLDICENNINDDTVIAFTRALVRNNTLKLLHLYQDPEDFEDGDMITERGWEALSTLLCNSSSTMDTYNSHHMLQDLTDDYYNHVMNLPDKLVSLLELNRNKDKVEVARQKILQTHFSSGEYESDMDDDSDDDDTSTSGDDTSTSGDETSTDDDTDTSDTSNIEEFLDMELEVIPTALSWIGRPLPQCWKGANISGLSLLYNVVRRVPDLFDSSAQKKKSGTSKRKRGQ